MKFIYGTNAKSAGIYQIKNLKSKKVYIGATTSFQHRWHEDKMALDAGVFRNSGLQRDYIKLGHNEFEISIIKVTDIAFLLKALTSEVASLLGPKCYNKHPVDLQKESFVLPTVETQHYNTRYMDREKVNKRSDEYAAAIAWAQKNVDKINAVRDMTLEEQIKNLVLPNKE